MKKSLPRSITSILPCFPYMLSSLLVRTGREIFLPISFRIKVSHQECLRFFIAASFISKLKITLIFSTLISGSYFSLVVVPLCYLLYPPPSLMILKNYHPPLLPLKNVIPSPFH
ncbi:uncharacterized protein DS421_3g93160 [Arachis hypogaea]|nr:uncharacterized protein DS421_3g93160 [Arachis hypogaea]